MILHQSSQKSLVYTYLLLAFAFVANSSHVHHSHPSRHGQYEDSIHRPHFSNHLERGPLEADGELLSNSSQKSTILSRGSEIDIVSFVDVFVNSWLRDSKPNSTQAELSDILATANRVKQAFLDPDSVSSLLPATVTSSPSQKRSTSHFHRSPTNSTVTSPAVTNSTLEEARAIVRLAQKEANARNKDRIDNPRVNNYYGKESSKPALKLRAEDAQLLSINATVAAAAAMVAEADAAHSNTTEKDYTIPIDIGRHEKRNLEKRAGSYWLENMNHVGRIPYGGPDNDNYPVFRNVKDYGAVGNGKVDDTAAINRAMTDGNRYGAKCGASSIKGAVVYFPAGQYLISSTIEMYYYTQMIGDATQRPILIAAKSFVGLGLLSSTITPGTMEEQKSGT